MATSGSKSITVTQWDTLKFSWSRSSYSTTNNTSTVKWTLSLVSGSSGRIDSSSSKDWSVTVNGTKYSGTNTVGISNNTTKTLASGTTTISHNTDGTKTFSYSFSQEFGITFAGESIGTKSGSGSGTLDTIPRKSSLSASNGTLGTAQTLTVSRQSSSFTHTIKYTCGTASGTIVTKSSSTSISFTPPLDLAKQNTTGTSVSVKFTITTYNGSTSLGSNTKTITCSIPSSVKPSASISLGDATGYSVYVKGYSKLDVSINAQKAYDSPIASYSVTVNGTTYTSSSFTTGVLASSGKMTIKATVKDKRGRSVTVTRDITVYDKSTLTVVDGYSLNNPMPIIINRETSKFTHNITYKCGSTTGTVVSGTSNTEIEFTPPLSLASQNTTGMSVSITYTLTTLCDGKSVGTSSATVSCDIPPAYVKPSCTISVSDPEGYYSTYGAYVKGLSKLNVTVKPTLAYGSPIASYSATADGKTYTNSTFTTPLLTSSGTLDLTATVTDKRGNKSSTASKSVTVLDYAKPAITKMSAIRCNQDGTTNRGGAYVKITFSSKVYALNNKNTATYKVQYKKASATSYTSVTLSDLANNYAVSNATYIFGADVNSSYNVIVSVTDKIDDGNYTGSVSTGFTLMHYHREGKGMAIGKVSEDTTKDYFDMGIHTVMQNNKYLCGMSVTTKDDSRAPTPVRMLYLNASNNTILGYGGFAYGYGTTNIYGNTVNIGARPKGKDDPDYVLYKPYYSHGDKIVDVTWSGAGYVSSAKKVIYFAIPLTKPVIGNPTIVVTSGDGGLKLRQNNAYTHESTSDIYAVPTSYNANANSGNHIQISATMDNTENVTNNSTIGIQWKGTITFE